jgi:hypothetical protein
MFFDARRATAMEAPGRNHELQKMLQLFTEFSLICIINFKFSERRKAGLLILIISFCRPFYRPLGSVARGGRTTRPTLATPLL